MADGDHMPKMGRTPSKAQLDLVHSLPDNDKVEWSQSTWKVNVANAFGEQAHRAEQEKIFGRMVVPAGPAGLLPEKNSYVCREMYGKEVILTRDGDGEVHAFLNVCMHRGSRVVVDSEVHKGKLLSCPFHAWGYSLKGDLAAVPREETFRDFCKADFGLPKLPCKELGGIIWIKTDPALDDDFSDVPPELITDLDALGVPTMHLFATGVHEVKSNWKLVMDTFQEGYHVTRLHSETLKGRFEDTIPRAVKLGKHVRRVSGRIGFKAEMAAGDKTLEELRKLVTMHYTLFPNAVIICSQIYVNFMVFIPTGPTTCRVYNYMLTDHPPATEKDLDRFTRSHHLTDEVTFVEDYAAAEYGQAGINTGAIKEFTLNSMEKYVWEFHERVEEALREPA